MNPLPSPGGRCIPPRGVAPPRHSPAAMPRLYLFGAPCAAGASASRLGPGIRLQPLAGRGFGHQTAAQDGLRLRDDLAQDLARRLDLAERAPRLPRPEGGPLPIDLRSPVG